MSITNRLYLILGIMVLLISAELSALWFTIHTLSAVRAYVGGEGLWSKAEKDAVYHLETYGRTRDPREYRAYETFLGVSLGDREARLAMSQPSPDPQREYRGFVQGRNDPADVPGMISLFQRFSNVSFIAQAIDDWTSGDAMMEQLQRLGSQLHRQVLARAPATTIDATLDRISAINQRLTVVEDRFSYTLGAGSRWLTGLVLKILFGAALTVELTGLVLTVLVTRGISIRVGGLLGAAERVARGDFTPADDPRPNDEIDRLTIAFNRMTQDLAAQRQRTDEAIRESQASLREAQRTAHIGSWEWDFETDAIIWSREMFRLHDVEPERLEASIPTLMRAVHPDDRPALDEAIRAARWSARPFAIDYRLAPKGDEVTWLCAEAAVVNDPDGKPLRMVGTSRDITRRKLAEEQLAFVAEHDGLTGLLNRRALADRLRQAIAAARRGSTIGALLFLDVDHFKRINDTLGHDAGDRLLRQIGRRLRSCVRASDIVARSGGDEFLIALFELADGAGAAIAARTITEALAEPFDLGTGDLFVSASIGISIFPGDSTDVETLVRCADTAMYQAKEYGRNNFQFFTAKMHEHAVRHLALDNELRRAVDRHEFFLVWQPIVDLASGRIVAAESLLRWRLESGAVRMPEDFVPMAESNGLIVPIGDWVMSAACAQARFWRTLDFDPIRATVNVSPRQIAQPDFVDRVKRSLAGADLDPRLLEVEVTETALFSDAPQTERALRELRALGVRVTLDDFGTGYSSLNHLRRLPVDGLKIDRSFVRGVATNDFDVSIVRAVITLSWNVGIETTAEGVESQAQFAALRELGCDRAQGNYFSAPLDGDALVAALKDWPSATPRAQ
jgi:diguanylate cyclase (GGDEF)-like protein/PAS domain S-box-containing protein